MQAVTGTIRHFLCAAALCGTAVLSPGAKGEDVGARHHPGIFVGALNAGGETDLALGMEYEYRISRLWGAGLVYETSNGAHHGDGVSAMIGAVYLHPHAGWRFGAGFGKEKVGGSHGYTDDLARLSIAYDFHIGGFAVAPILNLDRVGGHYGRVYGVSISKGF